MEQQLLTDKAINSTKIDINELRQMSAFSPSVIKEREKLIQEVRELNSFSITTKKLYYSQEVISKSICGLNVYMLTIALSSKLKKVPLNKRKCLFLQARTHAAETPGNFVMRELIKQITQDPEKYETILSKYVIKLVPMVNPDGVTFGNSRSSLVGVDLNRRWANPHCIAHPEIFYLKQVIQDSVGSKG